MPPSLNKEDNIDNVYRSPTTEPSAISNVNSEEANYNIIDWFKKCLRNYTNFFGRARRKEYWYFVLVQYIVMIIAMIIDYIIFDSATGLFYGVVALGLFIPSLAVTIRRLHDTSRSGWWFLIGLIPIIGSIILLIFLVTETKFESNQWGPPAK